MGTKANHDFNLEDMDKESLIALIGKERRRSKRRTKSIKADLLDAELALIIAIHERNNAYADLDNADNAIMALMDKMLSSK